MMDTASSPSRSQRIMSEMKSVRLSVSDALHGENPVMVNLGDWMVNPKLRCFFEHVPTTSWERAAQNACILGVMFAELFMEENTGSSCNIQKLSTLTKIVELARHEYPLAMHMTQSKTDSTSSSSIGSSASSPVPTSPRVLDLLSNSLSGAPTLDIGTLDTGKLKTQKPIDIAPAYLELSCSREFQAVKDLLQQDSAQAKMKVQPIGSEQQQSSGEAHAKEIVMQPTKTEMTQLGEYLHQPPAHLAPGTQWPPSSGADRGSCQITLKMAERFLTSWTSQSFACARSDAQEAAH